MQYGIKFLKKYTKLNFFQQIQVGNKGISFIYIKFYQLKW